MAPFKPVACVALALLGVLGAAQVRAQTAAPPWRLSANAEGAFDSNPRFLPDDDEVEATASSRLGALLERNWNLTRTRLLLRGDISRIDYRGAPDLSRNTWGVETQGTFALSPRVSVGVDAAARSDASRDLRALTDTGFVLAQVLTRTTRSRADLSWRLSEHATAVVETRYERYSFDSGEFVGGATLDGNARLDLTPWPRTTLTLSADVQRQRREDVPNEPPVSDGSSRSLYGTFTRGVPEDVEVSFTGGLTRFTALGSPEAQPTLLLGFGLRGRRGRHTPDLRGDRRASQAFGLGRSGITFTFTASDSLALTPRLDLLVRGNWSRTTDPADADFELRSWGATSELIWRAAPRLRARATYTFYRGEDRDAPPRTNHTLSVTLGYERIWR